PRLRHAAGAYQFCLSQRRARIDHCVAETGDPGFPLRPMRGPFLWALEVLPAAIGDDIFRHRKSSLSILRRSAGSAPLISMSKRDQRSDDEELKQGEARLQQDIGGH